jgi:hypothetical protein
MLLSEMYLQDNKFWGDGHLITIISRVCKTFLLQAGINNMKLPVILTLVFFLFYLMPDPLRPTPIHYCQEINPVKETISSRFRPPEGYHRLPADSSSFAWYLQHLPLKGEGAAVHYFDGRIKPNSHVAAAVIDIPVGYKDLMHCADAIIRIRAEYLRTSGQEDRIAFHFTNGSVAVWKKWKNGYRCDVSGNQVQWENNSAYSDSDKTFSEYLETVFMYSGTLSLEKELEPVSVDFIMPGDVFIEGGSPGHAVLVVDVAVHPDGRRVFMLAQGYMPAQDMHIIINPDHPQLSPWYKLSVGEELHTPEWHFDKDALKRF